LYRSSIQCAVHQSASLISRSYFSNDRTGGASDYSAGRGDYDFKLEYDSSLNADSTVPSLFTAIQEQLGLRSQAKKVPVEMIVIENIAQPSEN